MEKEGKNTLGVEMSRAQLFVEGVDGWKRELRLFLVPVIGGGWGRGKWLNCCLPKML